MAAVMNWGFLRYGDMALSNVTGVPWGWFRFDSATEWE